MFVCFCVARGLGLHEKCASNMPVFGCLMAPDRLCAGAQWAGCGVKRLQAGLVRV